MYYSSLTDWDANKAFSWPNESQQLSDADNSATEARASVCSVYLLDLLQKKKKNVYLSDFRNGQTQPFPYEQTQQSYN